MNKKIILPITAFFLTLGLVSCSTTQEYFQRQTTSAPVATMGSSSGVETALNTNDSMWNDNATTTWNRLQHTSLKTLETFSSTDPNIQGWTKLAIISKRYSGSTAELVPQLIDWRQEYPNHPGNQLFPDNNTLTSLQSQLPPKKIALLLPLQGQFAASGKAVREGFLGGYYMALSKNQPVPTLSFYDTSTGDLNSLYHKAASEGADMIVGPLLKDQVQVISGQGSLPLPTIALNYSNRWGSLPNNLYEFGLSPNDESTQLADKAKQAGLSHALLIAPESAWGRNVTKTLVAQWQAAGGTIVDTYYFTPTSNLAADIPRLLHINPKDDQDKMKTDNNRQDLQKQRRQDFDVIFLLAQPVSARQIVPLLHFYYVQDTPIYSTSVIYAGSRSPQKDNDLNGVIFCDTPWTLTMSGNKMQSNRLYGVGRDAYLLSQGLNRMSQLPNFPIYGTTGALTLTPQHQIYRRLAWAKFNEGQP